MKLDFNEFRKAYELLSQHLFPTPLIRNEWLSKHYECDIFLKLENLQAVGSFKLRGATYMMSRLTEEEKKRGVVAVSAGNHAQGVAWAAEKFGIQATIIMPKGSPLTKIANTQALGAKVILEGNNVDESFEYAKTYLQENNAVYVHPFNDPDVIYGQGSIGFELNEQIKKIDYVFGSIGGGGLMTGVGQVVKKLFEGIKVIGSQSTGANSMIKSLQQGKLIESETVQTFADGIKVRKPELKMYELLNEVIDEAVHVSDEKVAYSVLDLMEKARIITEGAGAINLAAFDELYQQDPDRFKRKNIVLIICGGNIDINLVDRIIDKGLIASKRRVKLSVLLKDRPGALMNLTKILHEAGANVFHIDHKRGIPSLNLNESIVEVTLEAKGSEHTQEILKTIGQSFTLLES